MSNLHIEINDQTGATSFKYEGDPLLISRAIMELAKYEDEFGIALNVVYMANNERKASENAFNKLVEMTKIQKQ